MKEKANSFTCKKIMSTQESRNGEREGDEKKMRGLNYLFRRNYSLGM